MARKKRKKKRRLNKWVVISLTLVGLAIVAGVGLSSSRVRNWLFPKDPVAAANRAAGFVTSAEEAVAEAVELKQAGRDDEAAEKFTRAHEHYANADKAYREAFSFSPKHPRGAEFAHLWGEMLLARSRVPEGLTDSHRSEMQSAGVGYLRAALQRDPNYIKSQKLLCELFWPPAMSPRQNVRPSVYTDEADKLLKIDPEDHVTWFRRGAVVARHVEIEGEGADKVLKDLRKAIELKPDELSYWLSKVAFEMKLKRFPAADATFKEALKVEANANRPELRIAYTRFLRQRNLREEAAAQIDEAIKRAPDSILPLLTKAELLRLDQRADEALPVLEQARKIDPTNYIVYRDLAIVHRMLKEPAKALAVLRTGVKTLEGQPSTAPASSRQERTRQFSKLQLNYELASSLLTAARGEKDKPKREEYLAEARACAKTVSQLGTVAGMAEGVSDSLAGRLAYASGKTAEALQLLEKAYDAFGQGRFDPHTSELLIQLHRLNGAPGKAEKIVNRFLSRPEYRRNTGILLIKAQLEMGYRKWGSAESYVRRALDIDPDAKGAGSLLALIRLNAGQVDKLPADLQLTSQLARPILERAEELWGDDQRDKALGLVQDLYKRLDSDENVALALLKMYQALNRDDDVKALLAKIKADQPELAKRIQFAQDIVNEKDPAKRLAMRAKRMEGIKDPLTRALSLADLYRSAGQTPQFLKYLAEAEGIKRDDPRVISRRFTHAVTSKKWDEAEKVVALAAEANADRVGGMLFAARLATIRGNREVAVEVLSNILTTNPGHTVARLSRGDLHMRQGQLDQAAEDFTAVWSSNPANSTAAIGMMIITQGQGKLAEYNDWLDRAHRLAPRHPEVVRRFTDREEQRSSNPEQIIAKREKQLARTPKDLNNRLRLGALYERVGKPVKAEEMYRAVWAGAADKLYGTRVLAAFLARTDRLGEAGKLIQDLLAVTKDKVGVYVLYGTFLAPHKPAQARRAFGSAIDADPKNPAGHFALAQFLAGKGDWTGAIHAMNRCVELRPDSPEVEKQLVSYLLSGKRYSDASRRLDRMLQANPSDARALRLRAQLLLDRDKDATKAEDLLSRAIRENPGDVASLIARANLYVRLPDLAKAKADLEKARDIRDSITISLDLANVYAALKQYGQAESALKGILSQRANMPQAVERLVRVYAVQKKWRVLEQLLVDTGKAYPDNPRYKILESQMWTQRREEGKALAALDAAAKIAPKDPTTIQAYLNGLVGAKKYDKVLVIAEPLLTDKKFAVWLPAIHARALAKTGKLAQAETIFQDLLRKVDQRLLGFVAGQMTEGLGLDRTIAVLPQWRARTDEWRLYNALGQLHMRADQLDKAIGAQVKARDLTAADSRERAGLNMQLGMAYYRTGRLAEAEKAYLAALPHLSNHPELLNNLAYMYVDDMKQPTRALPYAQRAYKQRPGNANVVDTYAWVLANLKRYAEAEKLLSASIAQGDAVPATRQHLGWIYEQQGKLNEARRQYSLGQQMITDRQRDKKLYDTFAESIRRVQDKLNR